MLLPAKSQKNQGLLLTWLGKVEEKVLIGRVHKARDGGNQTTSPLPSLQTNRKIKHPVGYLPQNCSPQHPPALLLNYCCRQK